MLRLVVLVVLLSNGCDTAPADDSTLGASTHYDAFAFARALFEAARDTPLPDAERRTGALALHWIQLASGNETTAPQDMLRFAGKRVYFLERHFREASPSDTVREAFELCVLGTAGATIRYAPTVPPRRVADAGRLARNLREASSNDVEGSLRARLAELVDDAGLAAPLQRPARWKLQRLWNLLYPRGEGGSFSLPRAVAQKTLAAELAAALVLGRVPPELIVDLLGSNPTDAFRGALELLYAVTDLYEPM